jgi:CRISPR/Cas system CSM-associated protein Csm3 (group 7 of RAMP superfamily)
VITLLKAEITVEPGWAVGVVPLGDPTLDRDLLTDAAGRPWVPGSALAGSLKAHLRASDTTAGTDRETRLMGSRPPTDRGTETVASRLWLLGARFTPDGDTPDGDPDDDPESAAITEVVGQTAIDRRRGAAAERSLRYSRTVAVGGTLTVYLRFDGTLSDTDLAALAAWRPAVGRGRTSGAGRARLRTLSHGTVDPTKPDGMRLWLTYHGDALIDEVATTTITDVAGPVEPWLTAHLRIEDALLVGDPRPTGPARARRRGGRPLIPGSAWKGLFRSRIEYILRSLYGPEAACPYGREAGPYEREAAREDTTGCGQCPTCTVFGHRGGRGRLAFRDSLVDDSRIDPPPDGESIRTHVAIDRVSGGSRDGQLFQTAPVTSGRLTLHIDELQPVDPWVRDAVWHVLHDLDDGLIGIGSRITLGMGTLRLEPPVEGPDPLAIPAGTTLAIPTLAGTTLARTGIARTGKTATIAAPEAQP